jgi:hypothetical protein
VGGIIVNRFPRFLLLVVIVGLFHIFSLSLSLSLSAKDFTGADKAT